MPWKKKQSWILKGDRRKYGEKKKKEEQYCFWEFFLAIKHLFFATLTLNIEVGNLDNKIKKEMIGYTKKSVLKKSKNS